VRLAAVGIEGIVQVFSGAAHGKGFMERALAARLQTRSFWHLQKSTTHNLRANEERANTHGRMGEQL
jgi:hypothetical protein